MKEHTVWALLVQFQNEAHSLVLFSCSGDCCEEIDLVHLDHCPNAGSYWLSYAPHISYEQDTWEVWLLSKQRLQGRDVLT